VQFAQNSRGGDQKLREQLHDRSEIPLLSHRVF